ncbi:MAG TPA: energy transducer TonB [Pyrinomonadaceae bacterium]|jgi:TonB family protein|nr:energy transducer TonB [Pyrinomonadaceae bacterium]
MKHLASLLVACTLAACAVCVPQVPAQSGRRGSATTSDKTYKLDLPTPPPEIRSPLNADEGEVTRCFEEEPGGNAATQASDGQQQQQTAPEIFTGKDEIKKAVIHEKPHPTATEEARRHGTSGTVRLRLVLGAEGRVTTVRVLKGLPDGLTQNAIKAACAVKFTPAVKDGRPVAQYVVIEYGFNIVERRGPIFPTGPRWP